MSFASSVELTIACCENGVIGGWQGGNVASIEEFRSWLAAISAAQRACQTAGRSFAPHAVNLPAGLARDAANEKLSACEGSEVPLVFSSVGDPTEMVKRVHGWGGRVIHDVVSIRHAEKALAAGVDGLMLTCAGTGGHTGFLSPFSFVPRIRSLFDGLVAVGGGIANGAGIAAALALGADLACMGTRFIATEESGAVIGHKTMIAEVGMDDIMVSDAMNGIDANWIRQSLIHVNLDPNNLPPKRGPMRGAELPDGVQAWKDIWSAGHSVGLINEVLPTSVLIDRLADEFASAAPESSWRNQLEIRWAPKLS